MNMGQEGGGGRIGWGQRGRAKGWEVGRRGGEGGGGKMEGAKMDGGHLVTDDGG